MAVESPGFANQNTTYGAEQTRRAIASMLARGASIGSIAGGLVNATDCQLTPPGSGMTVNVGPGEIWVPGSSSTTQSGYYGRVSSSTSLAIAASDPTNPRIDRVSALITDSAYAGGTNTFAVAVETGTPTAGATLVNLSGAAAAPVSSLTLGYVLVPATSTSVTGGNISNVAPVASVDAGMIQGLAATQFSTALAQSATVNQAGQVVKGATNISTSQATSSTTYTTLATPDQVTGIVLPTNGLILIWYQATWSSSVSGAGSAAIFIGANQQTAEINGTTPTAISATTTGTTNLSLATCPAGLQSTTTGGYSGDVTTGQAVGVLGSVGGAGSNCQVFAAPGVYTVSVQFKASSGSVTALNRKLWVMALAFS